jgi:hypothetical protein
MFDKIERKYSRRGKDLNDIATSSATMESMVEFDTYEKQEESVRNLEDEVVMDAAIDSMIPDAPAIQDEVISFKEDFESMETSAPAVEKLPRKEEAEIISSQLDDDDFQDI